VTDSLAVEGVNNAGTRTTTCTWKKLTFMRESHSRLNRKAERLLQKVRSERFTFPQSRGDLERLMSIYQGAPVNTKPGDPSFHAYAAAINVANEFAGQVLDLPDLISFNNQLADLQEEYMPACPPTSPVTSAFFAGWLVLDAQDDASPIDFAGAQPIDSPVNPRIV
jgi:hypothetical protein